jgi:Uma2 family endonuclease
MSIQARPRLTPEEYLAVERAAESKSEFVDGLMRAVPPANPDHVLITCNVAAELHAQTKARPCRIYLALLRVKVSDTGFYTYPDVMAVWGESRFEDDGHRDTLINPTLIVEVLSPTTEAYDRGERFANYQRLESLQEYLLIGQDRHRVEQYVRQAEGRWLYTEAHDLAATLHLPSIGCDLALSEVYDKVTLRPSERSTG